MQIRHPEWLQWEAAGQCYYGFRQDWYATSFQRTRGCGPTTAAMLLTYLARRDGLVLPATGVALLEDVWRFVRPGWLLGLNSTVKFAAGMNAYLHLHALDGECRRLSVPLLRLLRPKPATVAAFIEDALAADAPLAFLNLQRGREQQLESWHWLTIVGLTRGEADWEVVCYDNGMVRRFQLMRWLTSSHLGGGFVYVHVPVHRAGEKSTEQKEQKT